MINPLSPASPLRSRALVAIALVVAAAAITTLHRLGAADVCSSNEAVEAVFLQQMVEHDALLFPLENGRSPMYKPPLFHWTAVAIDRLVGIKQVTAFNLRLPAALYAIAGVILTIAFVYAFLGPGDAILAGLILTASYQYLENARIGRVDMTLCFFETLALFAFAWWSAPHCATPLPVREEGTRAAHGDEGSPDDFAAQADSEATDELRVRHEHPFPSVKGPETRSTGRPEVRSTGHEAGAIAASAPHQDSSMGPQTRGHNYLRYLLALALGLAVLAKGPVGAMLPGLAILLFLLAERRLRDVWKLATPGPVILTLAIASSWYLACLFGHHYGFVHRQIGSENFGRFFGSLGAMGLSYYIKPLLLNSVPLSLLVPVAGFFALCTYRRSNEPSRPFPLAREPGVRSRPSQNPLSLWMSLRMMFLPAMDDSAANPPASAGKAGRVILAVRLFAIFWVTTVLFFTVAAYKRRTYLLPLWPASAVILSWWLASLSSTRSGKILRRAVAATCVILITTNFFYLPRKEVRECAGDSMREAAAQINRVVGATEPLYLFQFEDEPAPFLFYLDRTAPRIWGKLGDAPPGYVITTAEAWDRLKGEALDLQPVLESSSGRPRLVLLRHGKALARR
jgi:4-amino-4-deoxy-L-arabinose transferase-like glycosyltransferase